MRAKPRVHRRRCTAAPYWRRGSSVPAPARGDRGSSTPLAIVDAEALWANADDLARRAAGVPIRVASKSVRVRSIVERTLARDAFAGIMSYSLAESNWLVDHGATDVLLAYPTVDADALRDLVADERRTAAITVMIDSIEALDVIDSMLDVARPEIRVCLDVDASLRIGPRAPRCAPLPGAHRRRGHPHRPDDQRASRFPPRRPDVLRRPDRRPARHLGRRPSGQEAVGRRADRASRADRERRRGTSRHSRSSTPAAPAASR